ncbi:MAG: pantetheine-phosphate adenylyltransferase [Planctomycetota bacterium]|jgi:pantetheine-phosphate adenylyltransferase|nr:pantetheine-phosphate adenylyltransferase [Planctomycetota bacterium]
MRAVYAGSFDPITRGHLDIIRRACGLFGGVLIGVGENARKKSWFSLEERLDLVRQSTAEIDGVEVLPFQGLVVDFAQEQECDVLVRGLRGAGDLGQEFPMAFTNRDLGGGLETVFLLASPENLFVASSLVREVAWHGGAIEKYVPRVVAEAVRRKQVLANPKDDSPA